MANDVLTTARSPIADTASAKLRGTTAGGIHAFKGIPYGASTEGANRFTAALPTWPTHNPTDRATMLFNARCQVAKDPDREARLAWMRVVEAQG